MDSMASELATTTATAMVKKVEEKAILVLRLALGWTRRSLVLV
jgi:hypothetical protein